MRVTVRELMDWLPLLRPDAEMEVALAPTTTPAPPETPPSPAVRRRPRRWTAEQRKTQGERMRKGREERRREREQAELFQAAVNEAKGGHQ